MKAIDSTALIFSHVDRNDMIVTRHAMARIDGKVQLRPGEPLATHDVAALLEAIGHRHGTGGWIDPQTVFLSSRLMVWSVPGRIRSMWFNLHGAKRRTRLSVPWPNLLFAATDTNLYVVAYRGDKRPTRSTKLYHAPLMNVYENSAVCLGGAARPEGTLTDSQAGWERVIFDTCFSHPNHGRALKIPGVRKVEGKHHIECWRSLQKECATAFPPSSLSPLKKTLEGWINGLS